MFLLGSSVSVPSPWSSYDMNTRFPNSRKRSHLVHPGRQSSVPHPTSSPQSQYSSESGPQGPGPPTDQKFSDDGSGTIRSDGIPIRSQWPIASSSGPSFRPGSPACTLTHTRSQSSFSRSWMNSVAYSIAPSLKYRPNEKLPSISKNVRWNVSSPTSSMSGVRKHFWTVVVMGAGGGSRPRKYGICGCIPALVSSVERSSARGISDAEGRRRCPFDSKNDRKPSRSSAVVRTRPIVGAAGLAARGAAAAGLGLVGRDLVADLLERAADEPRHVHLRDPDLLRDLRLGEALEEAQVEDLPLAVVEDAEARS